MKEILEHAMELARQEIPYGETASYIPELGNVNKNQLGVSIFTCDGKRESVGDTKVRFTNPKYFQSDHTCCSIGKMRLL